MYICFKYIRHKKLSMNIFRISLPQDKAHQVYFRGPRLGSYIMFSGLRAMTRDDLEENGPPLSTKEAKLAKILQTVPFMISFSQRVLMFQNLILSDKQESQVTIRLI